MIQVVQDLLERLFRSGVPPNINAIPAGVVGPA